MRQGIILGGLLIAMISPSMAAPSEIVPIIYHRRHRRHYRVVVKKRPLSHSAAIVGGSAGAGAAVGALAGGVKGAAIGALAGGTGGLIYDRATHKKRVLVPVRRHPRRRYYRARYYRTTRRHGTVVRKRPFRRSAAIVGGSAGAGAAVGALAGGGKGAAIGALAGGAGGLVYDRATHKKRVQR